MDWRRIKMRVSSLAKAVLFHFGLFHLLRTLFPNRSVAVLRYHAVVDPQDNFYASPGISMPVKDFERHVRYFAKRYRILSLDEVVEALQSKQPLPANTVVFTFDDGYADNFRAAQILKAHGASGTFYLTTDCIDRREPLWLVEVNHHIQTSKSERLRLQVNGTSYDLPLSSAAEREQAKRQVVRIIKGNDLAVREQVRHQIREQLMNSNWQEIAEGVMLNWDQVRQMAAEGMVIGGHTMTHLNLPNASKDDAFHEISGCRFVLEKKLGRAIRHFSVPNSGPYEYYNEEVKQMVSRSGFLSSVTSAHGFVDRDSDLFELCRIRTVPQLHEVVATIELGRVSNSAKRIFAGILGHGPLRKPSPDEGHGRETIS